MNELILKCNSTDGVVRLSQTLFRRKENLRLRDRFRPGTRTAHRIRRMLFCSQTFIQAYYRPKEPLFLPPQHMLLMAFITRKRKKGRWVAFNIVQRTLQRCVLPCFASSTQLQLITYNGSQGKRAEVCKAFLKWYFTQFLSRLFLHYRNEEKKL